MDIRITAGTCKEHYQNGVDAFLLASSDSDFWGLITALPTADFMVLIEQAKYGDCLKAAFDKNGIAYCFMDDFASNITDIKTAALKHSIRDYLEERIQVNVQDMMDGRSCRSSDCRLQRGSEEWNQEHNPLCRKARGTCSVRKRVGLM